MTSPDFYDASNNYEKKTQIRKGRSLPSDYTQRPCILPYFCSKMAFVDKKISLITSIKNFILLRFYIF